MLFFSNTGTNQHSSLAQWSRCLPECGTGIKVRAQSTADRQLVWEAIQCEAECPGTNYLSRILLFYWYHILCS